MKKFLILLLSVVLILSITACTSNEKNGEEKKSDIGEFDGEKEVSTVVEDTNSNTGEVSSTTVIGRGDNVEEDNEENNSNDVSDIIFSENSSQIDEEVLNKVTDISSIFTLYKYKDKSITKKDIIIKDYKDINIEIELAKLCLEQIDVSIEELEIINITNNTNCLSINLKETSPILTYGAEKEYQILNTLALTFIMGNDYESVSFYIDKEPYTSQNYSFVDGFWGSKNILLNNWEELYPGITVLKE